MEWLIDYWSSRCWSHKLTLFSTAVTNGKGLKKREHFLPASGDPAEPLWKQQSLEMPGLRLQSWDLQDGQELPHRQGPLQHSRPKIMLGSSQGYKSRHQQLLELSALKSLSSPGTWASSTGAAMVQGQACSFQLSLTCGFFQYFSLLSGILHVHLDIFTDSA